MKVSQQSDVESSLNSLNELLRPALTGQRKQQGQEAPRAPTPSPQTTPSQAKLPVGLPGIAQWMGQEASLRVGRRGEAPHRESVEGKKYPILF